MHWLVLLLPLLVAGCPPIGEMVERAGEPTAEVVSTTEPTIEVFQLEPYDGPKARVAVYRFGDRTAKGGGRYRGFGWYSPEIGNGMADMLNDALLKSNRFIVLERQALKDVLQEQDLAASGRVRRETAAPIGQIEGAELLIKGAITEFEPGARGARGGFGAGGFGLGWGGGLGGALIGGLLSGIRESHVAMIIQVVDARTSRLLFSTTVEGTASDFDISGLLAGFGGGFGAGAGLGTWQKTPVEKAIRIAILKAVKELSKKTPKTYFRHGADIAVPAPALPPSPAQRPIPSPVFREDQRVRHAQELLKQLGFDPGLIDGIWGSKTKTAIAEFQSHKMKQKEATGQLDELTYTALKKAAAEGWQYAISKPEPSQEPGPVGVTSEVPSRELPSAVLVKVKRATLLDAPPPEGKPVGTVKKGAKLLVQAEDKGCYFIRTEDGKQGWIYISLTKEAPTNY